MPNNGRVYKWGLKVRMKNDKTAAFRAKDKYTVFKLHDIISYCAKLKNKQFGLPANGIWISKLNVAQIEEAGLNNEDGSVVGLVSDIAKESPAEESGFKIADIVLEVNGKKLTNRMDFYNFLIYGEKEPCVNKVKILRKVYAGKKDGNMLTKWDEKELEMKLLLRKYSKN